MFKLHSDFILPSRCETWQVLDFDGLTLAAKCLVRLCEQGNLAVAAELIKEHGDKDFRDASGR